MRVQIDIRDDSGSLQTCLSNYRDMVATTDYLFGPAYEDWNQDVKTLLDSYGKILITWAANPQLYTVPPFMSTSTGLAAWADAPWPGEDSGTARRLVGPAWEELDDFGEEGDKCPSANRSLEEDPIASAEAIAWLQRQPERPPPGLDPQGLADWLVSMGAPPRLVEHVGSSLAPLPEDAGGRLEIPETRRRLSTNNASFRFDINVAEDTWALGTLRKVYAAGARSFLFVSLRGFTGGTQGFAQCSKYADAVRNFPGVSWSFAYGIRAFEGHALDMHVVEWLKAEVVVHCGRIPAQVVIMNGITGYRIAVAAYVSTLPTIFGTPTYSSTRSFSLEPSPFEDFLPDRWDEVFGTLGLFVSDFERWRGRSPGYAALQTSAAAVVLTQALMRAEALDAESIAKYLRGLRGSGSPMPHFLGSFEFDEEGLRVAVETGTRQILPLERRITGYERFTENRVVQVSSAHPNACDLNSGQQTLDKCEVLDSIHYPSADLITREVQSYPCMAGCIISGLNTCGPCPPGRFHSYEDQECRDCYPGSYADVAGMSVCRDCPKGGDCTDASQAPLAQPTFFRINMSESMPEPFACDSAHGPQLTEFIFVPCRFPEVCAGYQTESGCTGVNTGMTCGQCPVGYTYSGVGAGSRECRKCPSPWIVLASLIATVIFYVMLLQIFNRMGICASKGAGYVPLTTMRAMLHYFHMLGIATEVSRIDGAGWLMPYFLMPISLLYRPLDLISIECVYTEETDSLKTISRAAFGYRMFLVGGYGSIVMAHILYALSSFLKNLCLACLVTLRKTLKARKSSKGQDQSDLPKPKQPQSILHSNPSNMRNSASSSDKAATADDDSSISSTNSIGKSNPFSLIHGPGLAYTEHLASLAFEVSLKSSLIRNCLIWTILVYPIYLRGVSRMFACQAIGPPGMEEERMVANFDVICDSDVYHRQLKWTTIPGLRRHFTILVMLIFPVVLGFFAAWEGKDKRRSMYLRKRSAVLVDGYRSTCSWWELLHFMRTGVLILLPDVLEQSASQPMLTLVLVFFFGLQFFMQPYESRFRNFVHFFELMALLGVMSFLIAGYISLGESKISLVWFILALVWNLLVILYAFWVIFAYTVSMKVEAIIEAGSSVSRFTRRVHTIFQIFPGLSPVYYYRSGDVYLIDVSHLNGFERFNLAHNLTKTVNVCLDCSDKFKTWVVERAIHEAFRRAISHRNALLRHLYEKYGTSSFNMCRIFSVTLRAPDIPPRTEEKENPHVDADASGRRSTDVGVTVDELNDALLDVNYDIVDHHPCIFGRQVAIRGQLAGRSRKLRFSPSNKNLYLQYNEDSDSDSGAEGQSLMDKTVSSNASKSVCLMSEMSSEEGELAQEMADDTAEYKRFVEQKLVTQRQLEEELSKLNQEYEELNEQLKTALGQDRSLN